MVRVAEQEQKTKGGILLPVSAQKRPTSGQYSSSTGMNDKVYYWFINLKLSVL